MANQVIELMDPGQVDVFRSLLRQKLGEAAKPNNDCLCAYAFNLEKEKDKKND